MSRDDTQFAAIPKSVSELTKLRRRFDLGGPMKSADLAPAVAAVETTYHRLAQMMRRLASEEWDAAEMSKRS